MNLQAVNRELKALEKKVDKIVIAVGKLEKPKVAKKPKAKVVKRKPVEKTVAKKVAVKKPAAKKTTKTVIDTVLAMIRRSKKGVKTATLMKKTGFNERQIHNNIYKLKKQGAAIARKRIQEDVVLQKQVQHLNNLIKV